MYRLRLSASLPRSLPSSSSLLRGQSFPPLQECAHCCIEREERYPRTPLLLLLLPPRPFSHSLAVWVGGGSWWRGEGCMGRERDLQRDPAERGERKAAAAAAIAASSFGCCSLPSVSLRWWQGSERREEERVEGGIATVVQATAKGKADLRLSPFNVYSEGRSKECVVAFEVIPEK